LYTKENLTQAEIAARVGVTRVMVNKWINAEKWELLKSSVTISKEAQLNNLYRQLAELNNTILTRDDKARYPYPAEAAVIAKLSLSIKNMETEAGIAKITSVFTGLLQWIRTFDAEQAKQITPLLDGYIKSKLT
jgi:transcriptional regulator with XRE-family HTH domain